MTKWVQKNQAIEMKPDGERSDRSDHRIISIIQRVNRS
jgi:hypothetical protein